MKGEEKERQEKKQLGGRKREKRQVRGMKRQRPKPELGQAGASGEELGEQECQAEVQEGHGSHHQRVGSSLERWGKAVSVPEDQVQLRVPPPALAKVAKQKGPRHPSS